MKAAIPSVQTEDQVLNQAMAAIKQNMDQMTGQQKNVVPLSELDSTATLAEVISQLNAILVRLQ